MISRILVPLTLLLAPYSFASAHIIEEQLPFVETPERQWVAVVSDGNLKLIGANLRKTPNAVVVSATLAELDENALVSGVVRLTDGRVYSTPFHPVGRNEVALETSSAAQARVEELQAEIAEERRKLAELEAQTAAANSRLREAAGLGDVDKVYSRIVELDKKIAQAEAARRESEEALAKLKGGR